MRKYKIFPGVLIASIILLTGYKKNIEAKNIFSGNPYNANSQVGIFKEPIKVSIAEATAIQGDKGQKPVRVMIYLSQPATETVTVKYSTEDGSAKAGVDYVATKGSVTFEPGEAAKWITVLIIGEVAADADEDALVNNAANFKITISNATGAIISMASAFITILQHIARNPFPGVPANQAIYEVIISYTGYLSDPGTDADCGGIRTNGVVTLSGWLSGIEKVGADDDIMYTGNLEMIIDIDICGITRLPGTDKDKFCVMGVNGSGKVFTELEIYSDQRGGYIKIENKDGKFKKTVAGDCADQIGAEWTMVPNKSIASVFNGSELPELTNPTLLKGIYSATGADGKTVVEVVRKIR